MRGKRIVAILLAVVGAAFFFGNIPYESYLRNNSPTVPTIATGQVIGMGRGNHFFVTSAESTLSECLAAIGFVFWMVAIAMFQRIRENSKR